MDARTHCNVEIAALLPDGAEVTPSPYSNLEHARMEYVRNMAEHADKLAAEFVEMPPLAALIRKAADELRRRELEYMLAMFESPPLDAGRISKGLRKATFGFAPTLDDLMG